jgi:translocation and assembly module TamB
LHGRIDGNISPKVTGITGDGSVHLQLDGTLADPRVAGDLDVRKLDVNLADLPAMPTTKGKTAPSLRFDIAVALHQLRLKALSLVDVPASGTLKLTGTLANPGINGQLQSDRGRINYLGTNFTVEEAIADFAAYRGLMPALDLWGTTWVGQNTIALRMTGVPPDLQFHLGSEPPLSQQEILALLEWPGQIGKIGSGNTGDMARGIVEVLQGGIELGLMSGIEEAVRDSLGLDEFRLEPNLSERRIRLSAGKYLLPRIYMVYDRSLFTDPDQDIQLEYRLDNGWKVSAGLRDGGEMRLGLEARLRF